MVVFGRLNSCHSHHVAGDDIKEAQSPFCILPPLGPKPHHGQVETKAWAFEGQALVLPSHNPGHCSHLPHGAQRILRCVSALEERCWKRVGGLGYRRGEPWSCCDCFSLLIPAYPLRLSLFFATTYCLQSVDALSFILVDTPSFRFLLIRYSHIPFLICSFIPESH